jgi:hypothetical protein
MLIDRADQVGAAVFVRAGVGVDGGMEPGRRRLSARQLRAQVSRAAVESDRPDSVSQLASQPT